MVLFIIALIIEVVVVGFCAIISPPSPKCRRHSWGGRRSPKGFIGSLMSKKRAGVMCGPGGVSARGKRRRY